MCKLGATLFIFFLVGAAEPDRVVADGLHKILERAILENEARTAGLPPSIAEAVTQIESSYDPAAIGRAGEIGLMQIRPTTAAMLGFHGNAVELAKPQINIHYGVAYLAQAWRLANGDLCRALMKYRAGLGEEFMTARSILYCRHARSDLAGAGSPVAGVGISRPITTLSARRRHSFALISPAAIYSKFKHGTPAASRAFWREKATEVRAISSRVEAKWRLQGYRKT